LQVMIRDTRRTSGRRGRYPRQENEHEARNIHPRGHWDKDWDDLAWASSPDDVKVVWIEKARIDANSGIILASFNAA
jgi:hypothetical protein